MRGIWSLWLWRREFALELGWAVAMLPSGEVSILTLEGGLDVEEEEEGADVIDEKATETEDIFADGVGSRSDEGEGEALENVLTTVLVLVCLRPLTPMIVCAFPCLSEKVPIPVSQSQFPDVESGWQQ